MRMARCLLASLLVVGLAASCGRRPTESVTPVAFVPAATPSPPGPAGVGPQVTATLPPLPVLDVPTPGAQPDLTAVSVELQPGSGPLALAGTLAPGDRTHYVLAGQEGQALEADLSLAQGLAILSVLAAGHPLPGTQPRATHWSASLPSTQDYTIEVAALSGGTPVSYTLTLTLTLTLP